MGHSRMQKLSEGLGLPCLHHKSYNTHVDAIFEKSSEVMEVILALSREKVLEFYCQNHTEAFQDNGTLDLAVSFDGSWPKRGHTSKLGFGAVINVHTGLDVDFHARVTLGVTLAVTKNNMGSSGSHLFFPAVGCRLASANTFLGQRRDQKWIQKAEIAHRTPAKRRLELRK
ncbi:hypothetical protein PoB_003942300 [Plakobranchus ocellatus]|uniref:Mutator-like transposase domain-containing protein n=1 Tax=Plakobranchus ocellatus TaxID=259542 RepID=A0AAV4B1G3_9GAST|nr:hypothetical protein PoB_003942300 [Plakobranchus ocellatus]